MNVLESVRPALEQVGQSTLKSKDVVQAVETVVLWNGICQQAEHFLLGENAHHQFAIGEDPSCQFKVPEEFISGQSKHTIMAISGLRAMVTLPRGARAEVMYRDGLVEELDLDSCQGQSVDINGSAKIVVYLGPWTFIFKRCEALQKRVGPLAFNFTPNRWTFVSVAVHAAFFILIGLLPPEAAGVSLDPDGNSNRFVEYMILAPEVRTTPIPKMMERHEETGGELGNAHKDLEGKMGDKNAPKTGNRFAIKGPKHTKRIEIGKTFAKDMVKEMGILGVLNQRNVPDSVFGSINPVGSDPEDALGGLLGDRIGADFGYSGLGINGSGRGGGGHGEGTLGVTNTGLNRIGTGYGSCVDGLCKLGKGGKGSHRNWEPPKRQNIYGGKPTVKGTLSKEVIRRVIQRRLNEIKHCYEKGLVKNGGLSGRVAVRFIISGSGAVQTAAVSNSSLGSLQVEQCIAGAVRRMSFPKPENNGVVIVTYPFNLVNSNQ